MGAMLVDRKHGTPALLVSESPDDVELGDTSMTEPPERVITTGGDHLVTRCNDATWPAGPPQRVHSVLGHFFIAVLGLLSYMEVLYATTAVAAMRVEFAECGPFEGAIIRSGYFFPNTFLHDCVCSD